MVSLGVSLLVMPLAPITFEVTVDGVSRTGVIYASPKAAKAPLVFGFHGHGGSAQQAARSFRIHEEWPEAVVVYLQGLTGIAGMTDPQGKKSGWQKDPGTYGDRDIKFFDAAFKKLKVDYKIDTRRIYAMGHSNGSRFTNVLWNQRGSVFAALGSSGGQGGVMIRTNVPKSVFVVAGEKDPLVSYRGQMLSVNGIRQLLKIDDNSANKDGYLTTETGPNGMELANYFHPGGHEFPRAATKLMVQFFKRHPLV